MGYSTGTRMQQTFGYGALSPTLLNPPVVEDKGLTLVAPGSKASVLWSVNSTTTDQGAEKRTLSGYPATQEWKIVGGTAGNGWLTRMVNDGYAVLLQKPDFGGLQPQFTFVLTLDAGAIKSLAKSGGNYIVIDGPDVLIAQAQGIGPGPGPGPGPGGQPASGCPKGTYGWPPFCFGTPEVGKKCPPGTVGTIPNCTPKAGTKVCPPGTTGVFPDCTPIPPEKKTCPKGTTGVYPYCKKAGTPQQAKSALPSWLLPVVVGIGAVSVVALVIGSSSKKSYTPNIRAKRRAVKSWKTWHRGAQARYAAAHPTRTVEQSAASWRQMSPSSKRKWKMLRR
jgi:hypothetical protein